MRRAFAGVVTALGVGLVPSTVPTPPAVSGEPVRIMLLGDSVTQGSAGDWTWRYRLWRHFQAAGVAVEFVGPRDDLYDNVAHTHGSQAYADPSFDRDHVAHWGMRAWPVGWSVTELVEEYRPDVLVEMLGINDLAHEGRPPDEVVAPVSDIVADARAGDPDIDIVLAEAAQRWWPTAPAFNQGLASLALASEAERSRLAVARTSAGFDADADTWDTSHPNARGEAKIAAAVADALHELGIGPPAARPLMMPEVGPRAAAVLTVTPERSAARLAWTGPPGATAQYVWLRDCTAGESWRRLSLEVRSSPWLSSALQDTHRYQFRLQPKKGDDEPEGAVFSNTVDHVPASAHPCRASAPSVRARRHGLAVDWAPASGATSYRVRAWPAGRPATAREHSVVASSARLRGLTAGRRYVVSVTAVNASGPAIASPVTTSTASGPRAGAPRRLAARADGRRLFVSWRQVRHATTYAVEVRRPGGEWRNLGRTRRTGLSRPLPGSGPWVVRVRSWHQQLPGAASSTRAQTS